MDVNQARTLAQEFIGKSFIVSGTQVRGEKYYVSYRPSLGDSANLGGNMPVEVDPASRACRYISIDEVFDLNL